MGSYAEWDEEKKIEFLTTELQGKRPLIPAAMPMTNDVREVLHSLLLFTAPLLFSEDRCCSLMLCLPLWRECL